MTRPAPIICLAHGSRHPQADQAVFEIAERISESTGLPAFAAFLDFHPATLTTVAHRVVAAGYTEAVVVPLLFTQAFHARFDVPAAIAEAVDSIDATSSARLTLHLTDGLGTGADMEELVADFTAQYLAEVPAIAGTASAENADAADAVDSSIDKLALYSVGSSQPGANEAVAEFAGRVGARLNMRSTRAFVATGNNPGRDTEALLEFADERTVTVPLFVSPGLLWDKAKTRMPNGRKCTRHLGDAIAPVVINRACRALQQAH
ncbi:sirohydrochlorin chelatase [Corynebacterium jeikeium]|uniref:sirohydrochlorin chelatase n=1 Tax=Corynebacterium jeikeium TaxID=38289 RepID=UPI0008859CED|nr:CbiX/SirB N-terminal domain-containing protein [Corynebacterium jeikeium]SCX02833.1 sirohydrochlorin cobaltochelatase [Corynebacterium jeikeium]